MDPTTQMQQYTSHLRLTSLDDDIGEYVDDTLQEKPKPIPKPRKKLQIGLAKSEKNTHKTDYEKINEDAKKKTSSECPTTTHQSDIAHRKVPTKYPESCTFGPSILSGDGSHRSQKPEKQCIAPAA